ncbi:MAG: PHP domain-containing protein, partial [Spirochaetales bacterium]
MKSIYVPLWVKSNYSFLEGASHPDELVEQAAALGLPAIAITDRDGVYGIVKAHKAAKERGIKLIVGSEITVELGDEKNDRETGGALEGDAAGGSGTALASDTAGPGGTAPERSNATRGSIAPASETTGRRFRTTVVLLATNREGYANLCSLISAGRLRCAKGESLVTLATVEQYAAGLLCLSGCSVTELGGGDGVTAAGAGGYAGLSEKKMRKAANRFETESSESLIPKVRDTLLGRLSDAFPNSLYLQDTRHREPREPGHLQIIEELSRRFELPIAAATEVLYHTPERRELADVVAAIRHGVTLHAAGSRLAANGTHALLSPHEMRDRYADRPRHVERTFEIAERCRFSLDEIKYRYPTERVPQGYSTSEWLWELTFSGARKRYGGSIPADVRSQLQRELEVIDDLEYCGYFLTMWEIIEYCRRQGILAQGRGSAANSAVCYCLGITAVDPVRMELLFERFLSRERAEPPDIDLDIEHRRREEVIQHMYEKYGRDRA